MRSWTRARLMSGMAWARYWSRRRPGGFGCGGEGVDVVFGVVVEVDFEDGDGRRGRLFDASGGAVLVLDGAAALALGEHVLRRHG